MNSKYTMEDIEKFIIDFKNSLEPEPNEWSLIINRKAYQEYLFEKSKREIFEKHFIEAKNGNIDDQKKFIEQMTPVLDDYYSVKEDEETKKHK